jgi:hypothetical protein
VLDEVPRRNALASSSPRSQRFTGCYGNGRWRILARPIRPALRGHAKVNVGTSPSCSLRERFGLPPPVQTRWQLRIAVRFPFKVCCYSLRSQIPRTAPSRGNWLGPVAPTGQLPGRSVDSRARFIDSQTTLRGWLGPAPLPRPPAESRAALKA